MGRLFGVHGTLSPLVARRWVPVRAETALFKCQCEIRPLTSACPSAARNSNTEMSLATRCNQFRICMPR